MPTCFFVAEHRDGEVDAFRAEGVRQWVVLVTADFEGTGERSRLVVTVQLSSLAEDMEAGYRQGFGAGLDNLAGVTERTLVLQRAIRAPRALVWSAWTDPGTLPRWWGPEGPVRRHDKLALWRHEDLTLS